MVMFEQMMFTIDCHSIEKNLEVKVNGDQSI